MIIILCAISLVAISVLGGLLIATALDNIEY